MGLEEFEKELAESKAKETRKKRDRSRSRDRHHRKDRDHRHSHSSRRHHREQDGDARDDGHSRKRSRHHRETSEERSRRKRRERERDRDRDHDEHKSSRRRHDEKDRHRRSTSSDDEDRISRKRKSKRDEDDQDIPSEDDDGDDGPRGRDFVPPEDETLDQRIEDAANANIQRDSWMEAPSSLDIDYVQRKKKEDKSTYVRASGEHGHQLRIHEAELNHHLRDLQEGKEEDDNGSEPAEREVSYTFGDAGSQWRMTKLKGIYRIAQETGRSVEDVALEKYGDLRDFDDAREEEIEIDRKNTYGKNYVGKEKPSGKLYEERMRRSKTETSHDDGLVQGQTVNNPQPVPSGPRLSATELNKLKAQMMKAKLKKAANATQLEAEYNAAVAGNAGAPDPSVVVLDAMNNRMLAGGRKGEVIELENKRGRERGLVKENEDMSIDDMVRQERRTKGQPGGEGMMLAERIAKDSKFENDLDYLDENTTKLAARVPKSTVNLRNTAIQDYQRTTRILDTCPLCHHDDKSPPQPPLAPVLSLGTRVFLTLPTEPELSPGGAVIVPLSHHPNLLHCDDDEWEEIRNFMKALTRMYHDQGRDVLFYENAATPHRKLHAAMVAVPIPYDLGETAPAFFREAILASDDEWTQHKPLIDTLKAARAGQGRAAFRRALAKEMPYFHVWFELDGGLGHVVEDERRWPRGDLFAREVIGGMLDVEVEVVKRQGRWVKGDRRVEGWRKGWRKFDWTRVLGEG